LSSWYSYKRINFAIRPKKSKKLAFRTNFLFFKFKYCKIEHRPKLCKHKIEIFSKYHFRFSFLFSSSAAYFIKTRKFVAVIVLFEARFIIMLSVSIDKLDSFCLLASCDTDVTPCTQSNLFPILICFFLILIRIPFRKPI